MNSDFPEERGLCAFNNSPQQFIITDNLHVWSITAIKYLPIFTKNKIFILVIFTENSTSANYV